MSWNANGGKTTLQKQNRNVLFTINQIKSNLPISLPGYISFTSPVNGSEMQCGTAVVAHQRPES